MITVWCADIDAWFRESGAGPDQASILSEPERARAARLRGDTHRRRWLASHVALRHALATALDAPPESLEFAVGEHGKPRLAGRHAGMLEFSLSHSGGLALIAVSTTTPVGVDVELVESMNDLDAVAQRHFAPEESQTLGRLDGDARLDAFYRIWTRKEAYLKATGMGLGHALDRFAVSHARDDARIVRIDDLDEAALAWTLADLRLDAPYIGAVAAPARTAAVRVARLSPPH